MLLTLQNKYQNLEKVIQHRVFPNFFFIRYAYDEDHLGRVDDPAWI
jgi:hypothetical protein